MASKPDGMEKKNDKREMPDPKKGPEKRKKDPDDERNSGFRSSRIRESESRTSDTGDPSIP